MEICPEHLRPYVICERWHEDAEVAEPVAAPNKLVRNTDPIESKLAAKKIAGSVTRDSQRLLRGFQSLDRPATHRQAAVEAWRLEGVLQPTHKQVESLRRRGSDLGERGVIAQVGRIDGAGSFEVVK